MQYLPAIELTDDIKSGIIKGTVNLKPGQWLKLPSSTRLSPIKARFIGVSTAGVLYLAYHKRNVSALAASASFSRALWHLKRKHSKETVQKVPNSLRATELVKALSILEVRPTKRPPLFRRIVSALKNKFL